MRKKRHKNKHNQQPAAHHEKPTCHENVKCPSVYTVRIEADPEDEQRYTKEKEYRGSQLSIGKWLNRITAVGTLVGIAGLLYLYGTLIATRQSANAADVNSRATLQQVLAFEATEAAQLIITITPVQSNGALKAVTGPSDSIFIDWDVAAQNIGPTMAKSLNFSADIMTIANTHGGYVEAPGHPFSKLSPNPSPVGIPLKPAGITHFPYRQQIPGWSDVVSAKSSVVIYMQVSYVDIFNRSNYAPVCLYFDLSTKGFLRCP